MVRLGIEDEAQDPSRSPEGVTLSTRAFAALLLLAFAFAVPHAAATCSSGGEGTTAETDRVYVRVSTGPGFNTVTLGDGPGVEERIVSWQNGVRTMVWEESNNVTGLQSFERVCGDGSTLPPDRLVSHTYTGISGASIQI